MRRSLCLVWSLSSTTGLSIYLAIRAESSKFVAMKCNKLECYITADKQRLDEYGVDLKEEENTCSAWIPSKVGQVSTDLLS